MLEQNIKEVTNHVVLSEQTLIKVGGRGRGEREKGESEGGRGREGEEEKGDAGGSER